MKATVEWTDKLNFKGTTETSATVGMGPSPDPGKVADSATPMDLVLLGLGGCQAMDVAWILSKKKITYEKLWVELEAEKTDDHPKIFSKVHLKFIVVGDVSEKALELAARLSHEKYCSVGAMLGKSVEITHGVEVRES
ncbi:MAG: OsmC family protein [Thermoplasmata archaeon]|nr:OsmC family protein [Thermoplasmata archaeon]